MFFKFFKRQIRFFGWAVRFIKRSIRLLIDVLRVPQNIYSITKDRQKAQYNQQVDRFIRCPNDFLPIKHCFLTLFVRRSASFYNRQRAKCNNSSADHKNKRKIIHDNTCDRNFIVSVFKFNLIFFFCLYNFHWRK